MGQMSTFVQYLGVSGGNVTNARSHLAVRLQGYLAHEKLPPLLMCEVHLYGQH
jgi:hypothetical protein